MAKLPRDLSGRRMRKVLEDLGFVFRRQKGSHMVLRRAQPYARVIVPDHASLTPGTLRQILRDANLSIAQLTTILKSDDPPGSV